jgi:hypothetical protein
MRPWENPVLIVGTSSSPACPLRRSNSPTCMALQSPSFYLLLPWILATSASFTHLHSVIPSVPSTTSSGSLSTVLPIICNSGCISNTQRLPQTQVYLILNPKGLLDYTIEHSSTFTTRSSMANPYDVLRTDEDEDDNLMSTPIVEGWKEDGISLTSRGSSQSARSGGSKKKPMTVHQKVIEAS